MFVIVMVWATQAEILSKQTLSLTFPLFTGNFCYFKHCLQEPNTARLTTDLNGDIFHFQF